MSEMETRVAKAEWRIDAIEQAQQRQAKQVLEMGVRMESHHREVMSAIGSLRDDRAREEGAAQQREEDQRKRAERMKGAAIFISAIALAASLGWVNNSAKAHIPPPVLIHKAEDTLP